MARSLTITQEENPKANWLLVGFVLLAVAFLAVGSVITMAYAADEPVAEAR
ncbi:MAG: hypothetical protein AB8H79_06680 [Myxococcota bacterium]